MAGIFQTEESTDWQGLIVGGILGNPSLMASFLGDIMCCTSENVLVKTNWYLYHNNLRQSNINQIIFDNVKTK